MSLTYFKRYRMEIGLTGRIFSTYPLPDDYELVPWEPRLVDVHADIKYQSFRFEIDANVFPCFTERAGCSRLMHEIRRKEGFLPSATWLMVYLGAGPRKHEYCGTVQGLCDSTGVGAIQNLGITPHHRGRGLGTSLMYAALEAFQQAGMQRACLEVTAQNEAAVALYDRMGFRRTRTLYKAVEVAYT